MEPNFETPRITPEQSPSLPPLSPEVSPGTHEWNKEREQGIQPGEREQSMHSPSIAAPPVTDIAVPLPPQPVVGDDTQDDVASLLTSIPAIAADDDLIEKEWVDKAKQIIADTADDPHRREAAVNRLQREYLRKRYGKELGASD